MKEMKPPEVCPVCKADRDKFNKMKDELVWADEHRIGVARMLIVKLLKA